MRTGGSSRDKDARLAEALRANLRKRRAQSREPAIEEPTPEVDTGPETINEDD